MASWTLKGTLFGSDGYPLSNAPVSVAPPVLPWLLDGGNTINAASTTTTDGMGNFSLSVASYPGMQWVITVADDEPISMPDPGDGVTIDSSMLAPVWLPYTQYKDYGSGNSITGAVSSNGELILYLSNGKALPPVNIDVDKVISELILNDPEIQNAIDSVVTNTMPDAVQSQVGNIEQQITAVQTSAAATQAEVDSHAARHAASGADPITIQAGNVGSGVFRAGMATQVSSQALTPSLTALPALIYTFSPSTSGIVKINGSLDLQTATVAANHTMALYVNGAPLPSLCIYNGANTRVTLNKVWSIPVTQGNLYTFQLFASGASGGLINATHSTMVYEFIPMATA